jgi:AcrR family transcriptional regulator
MLLNQSSGTRRPYRKRKRAASELKTRMRITEAAVALHQAVGPGRTTVKAIAARARVDRATVYRHFPDAQALFDACTSHYYAQHPMPDPRAWAALGPADRLGAALADLYAWYGETEEMLASGIRDLEHVPAGSREAFLGYFDAVLAALMSGRRERGRARARVAGAIAHATSFLTWRSLVREQHLTTQEAVALMTSMVRAAPDAGRRRAPPRSPEPPTAAARPRGPLRAN